MHVVNVVWRGQVKKRFGLRKTKRRVARKNVLSSSFQNKQPQQVIIKFFNDSTMLLFKTGKFRIMGRTLSLADALKNVCIVTSLKTRKIPVLELQTMTAVHTFDHHLYLDILRNLIQGNSRSTLCRYDAEHFPAVQVVKYKPIHVNVFATGKIVICGLKDLQVGEKILNELEPMLMLAHVQTV